MVGQQTGLYSCQLHLSVLVKIKTVLMPVQPQKKKPSMVSHLAHPSLLRGGLFPRRARKRGKTDFCLLNYFFAHSFQSKHFPCHKMKFYPKSKKCFLKTNHKNQL